MAISSLLYSFGNSIEHVNHSSRHTVRYVDESQLDPTPGILWNVNTTGPVDLTLIRDAWVKERRQAEQLLMR
ncbi:hypothetical protein T12_11583 [Trichinella patagoniensis]|uniref:Uncharacterized protein n=1 Tax=Trichinella patagoniensis TaxID=990121 RepID=A0A0V0ZNT5_9BILA|nr:hypothetical protein T12_11583 [Trichinella patagoniensis]